MISQIERGQSRPSVGTLFALASVLEVPVDDFFADGTGEPDGDGSGTIAPSGVTNAGRQPTHDGSAHSAREAAASGQWTDSSGPARHVVRSSERAAIEIRGGVRWERLTRTALDGIEFLELVYAPGAESDRQSYRHPGVELVIVTTGVMTIELGFERYELRPGDSIAFASSTPHRYVNETDSETRAITAILHDELSSLELRDRDSEPTVDEEAPA